MSKIKDSKNMTPNNNDKVMRRDWTIYNGDTNHPTIDGPAIAYAENVKVREVGAGLVPIEDVFEILDDIPHGVYCGEQTEKQRYPCKKCEYLEIFKAKYPPTRATNGREERDEVATVGPGVK